MKKVKYLLIILLLLLFVPGCTKEKDPIDITKVRSVIEEYNITVVDTTDKYDYAAQAYYGYKDEIKINFVKGNKRYDIQGLFLDECKNIYSVCGNDYKKDDNVGDNWTNLTVTNKDKYYYAGWVGDSYITIVAPISSKSDMESLVQKLGF